MPFADDLLDLAKDIVNLHAEGQREANLRRAVSTAYYAIFHLLISEATLNWNRIELRKRLSRVFEHGKMKSASENKVSDLNTYLNTNPPACQERTLSENLRVVCNAFIQAQQLRNDADYNLAKTCKLTDVEFQIDQVTKAFKSWKLIRDEDMAQAYLVSLLGGYGEKRADPPKKNKSGKSKQPPL